MSLLLPERYQLNLFPEHSSLSVGKRAHSVAAGPDIRDLKALVLAADGLLSKEKSRSVWRPQLDILISDEVAHLTLLPWQDRLRTHAQHVKYAEACLAEAGLELINEWAIQPLFRRHGAPGLGVALRREHLEQLATIARERLLRFRTILPFSAAAYWSHGGAARGKNGLLILEEPNRITALSYRERKMQGIDVEPIVGGQSEQAVRRLLLRTSACTTHEEAHYCAAYPASSRESVFQSVAPYLSFQNLQPAFLS
ncbi:MAG: hypothetical protein ACXWC4_01050 [Telluria sp.]